MGGWNEGRKQSALPGLPEKSSASEIKLQILKDLDGKRRCFSPHLLEKGSGKVLLTCYPSKIRHGTLDLMRTVMKSIHGLNRRPGTWVPRREGAAKRLCLPAGLASGKLGKTPARLLPTSTSPQTAAVAQDDDEEKADLPKQAARRV